MMARLESYDKNLRGDRTLRVPQLISEDDHEAIVLVPSHNRQDVWHQITISKDTDHWACDCEGYRFRQDCVHSRILKWYSTFRACRKRSRGVSDTSLEAYHKIDPSDLAETYKAVYRALEAHPHSSDNDLEQLLGWRINRITGRRNDLYKRLGMIEHTGYKQDPTTNNRVKTWAVL